MPPIQNAIQFLAHYPLGTPFTQEAGEDFKNISAREKYAVLKELSQNLFKSRDFLKALLPTNKQIASHQDPLERMKALIALTKKEVGNDPIKNDENLWNRRWRVARMLYKLEAWQLGLQKLHVENPENKLFDTTHSFLVGALQTFYRETRPDPSKIMNTLFDTDFKNGSDGVFDDTDAFPLDPNYSKDINGDEMPDELNDPRNLLKLSKGKRYQLTLPDGRILYSVTDTKKTTRIEVPVRFTFENRAVKRKFKARWGRAKKRAAKFINSHSVILIDFRLVKDKRAAHVIRVRKGKFRKNYHKYSLDLLKKEQTIVLAHENLHLIGPDDRYQEDYIYGKDYVFKPGWYWWTRRSQSSQKDIMLESDTGTEIMMQDILIPIGLAQNPAQATRVIAKRYEKNKHPRDEDTWSDRADELFKEAEWAPYQSDKEKELLIAAIKAREKALQLNPESHRDWYKLAKTFRKLLNNDPDLNSNEKHRYADLELKARNRLIELVSESSKNVRVSYQTQYEEQNLKRVNELCIILAKKAENDDKEQEARDYYKHAIQAALKLKKKQRHWTLFSRPYQGLIYLAQNSQEKIGLSKTLIHHTREITDHTDNLFKLSDVYQELATFFYNAYKNPTERDLYLDEAEKTSIRAVKAAKSKKYDDDGIFHSFWRLGLFYLNHASERVRLADKRLYYKKGIKALKRCLKQGKKERRNIFFSRIDYDESSKTYFYNDGTTLRFVIPIKEVQKKIEKMQQALAKLEKKKD